MNKIRRYLSKPFPLFEQPWLYTAIIALTCLLILAIFEPFNYRLNSVGQFWLMIGFVMEGAAVCLICYFLFPVIFKRYYNPEQWTVGKNIVHYVIMLMLTGMFVVITDMIVLPNLVIGTGSIDIFSIEKLNILFIDLMAGITIALIPVVIINILTKNRALHHNLKEAIQLNKTLAERVLPAEEQNKRLTLAGNTKESIDLFPQDIRYIEASGNYVEIYYSQGEKVFQKLLRATIKQMEEQLQDYPQFIRSHRAFIVNSNQIINVSGNAQGYRLSLNNISQEIPVSRTYMKSLKDTLK